MTKSIWKLFLLSLMSGFLFASALNVALGAELPAAMTQASASQ
jgi:hypothetical protein